MKLAEVKERLHTFSQELRNLGYKGLDSVERVSRSSQKDEIYNDSSGGQMFHLLTDSSGVRRIDASSAVKNAVDNMVSALNNKTLPLHYMLFNCFGVKYMNYTYNERFDKDSLGDARYVILFAQDERLYLLQIRPDYFICTVEHQGMSTSGEPAAKDITAQVKRATGSPDAQAKDRKLQLDFPSEYHGKKVFPIFALSTLLLNLMGCLAQAKDDNGARQIHIPIDDGLVTELYYSLLTNSDLPPDLTFRLDPKSIEETNLEIGQTYLINKDLGDKTAQIPMKKWYNGKSNKELSWALDFRSPYWHDERSPFWQDLKNVSEIFEADASNGAMPMRYWLHRSKKDGAYDVAFEPDWSPLPEPVPASVGGKKAQEHNRPRNSKSDRSQAPYERHLNLNLPISTMKLRLAEKYTKEGENKAIATKKAEAIGTWLKYNMEEKNEEGISDDEYMKRAIEVYNKSKVANLDVTEDSSHSSDEGQVAVNIDNSNDDVAAERGVEEKDRKEENSHNYTDTLSRSGLSRVSDRSVRGVNPDAETFVSNSSPVKKVDTEDETDALDHISGTATSQPPEDRSSERDRAGDNSQTPIQIQTRPGNQNFFNSVLANVANQYGRSGTSRSQPPNSNSSSAEQVPQRHTSSATTVPTQPNTRTSAKPLPIANPPQRRFMNAVYTFEHPDNSKYFGEWVLDNQRTLVGCDEGYRYLVFDTPGSWQEKELRYAGGRRVLRPESPSRPSMVTCPDVSLPQEDPTSDEMIVHHGVLFRPNKDKNDKGKWKEEKGSKLVPTQAGTTRISDIDYIVVNTPQGVRLYPY